jgi:hypothetical protein
MAEKNDHPLLRLIDPRIPLPWLVAAIVAAAGMFFQLQSLSEALRDLKITVNAGNQSWATLAGEQALQKFRQGIAEEDIKNLKAAVLALQQGRR